VCRHNDPAVTREIVSLHIEILLRRRRRRRRFKVALASNSNILFRF
jgi:hypothetical protein